jgi:outer membrane lipopolysaccharide assembly protein LptE/RlpB
MKKIILICFTVSFLTSCGFKLAENNLNKDFKITILEALGEKRINYKLKNNLNIRSSSNKEIFLNLNTAKKKRIKEKNESNEIVKYEIEIITTVNYNFSNNKKSGQFKVAKKGDFKVENQHIGTLENEKNLINILIQNMSEQIIDQINLTLNAS